MNDLVKALRSGEQADMDGTLVKVSRQACEEAAEDERTLRNWKSLHYEKLKGDREGQRSVRLNDQYRLIFLLDADTSPPKIIVLGIEDYH